MKTRTKVISLILDLNFWLGSIIEYLGTNQFDCMVPKMKILYYSKNNFWVQKESMGQILGLKEFRFRSCALRRNVCVVLCLSPGWSIKVKNKEKRSWGWAVPSSESLSLKLSIRKYWVRMKIGVGNMKDKKTVRLKKCGGLIGLWIGPGLSLENTKW